MSLESLKAMFPLGALVHYKDHPQIGVVVGYMYYFSWQNGLWGYAPDVYWPVGDGWSFVPSGKRGHYAVDPLTIEKI